MFNTPSTILAHESVTNAGNFVTHEYILNRGETSMNLFRRFCPHRMYPLAEPGSIVENIVCGFHGFAWNKDGTPINNDRKIGCGSAAIGKSGLVFKNFVEPEHQWVYDLSKETELKYSHCYTGHSKGSWLWFMDVNADLLHVQKDGIHPVLSKQVELEDVGMETGDGWALQTHPDGWWLCIYPFSFVEYSRPGMLSIMTVTPDNINNEYGYTWLTQVYYEDSVDINRRMIFETLDTVFKEDIEASELQKGDYFPLMEAHNRYEEHCVHFGEWVKEHRNK